MAEQRRDVRKKCNQKCVLNFADLHFFAELKDISISGVLLRPDNRIGSIHVGDKCFVGMGGDPPHKLLCEVVRIDGSNIGMKIV
jgi:hypothetical protein